MPANSTGPIRVLLIDDHVVMRKGLRMLIETQPGLSVVGEATDREDPEQPRRRTCASQFLGQL